MDPKASLAFVFGRINKLLGPAMIRTLDHPASNLVTTLMPSQLQYTWKETCSKRFIPPYIIYSEDRGICSIQIVVNLLSAMYHKMVMYVVATSSSAQAASSVAWEVHPL